VKFTPSLPFDKINVISRFDVSNLNRFWLMFDQPFWNISQYVYGLTTNSSTEKWSYFINHYYTHRNGTGLPILEFYYGGKVGYEMENMTDLELKKSAMNVLRLIFKNNVTEPIAYSATRWGSDPFAGGSYTASPPKTRLTDLRILGAPIGNTLFFCW